MTERSAERRGIGHKERVLKEIFYQFVELREELSKEPRLRCLAELIQIGGIDGLSGKRFLGVFVNKIVALTVWFNPHAAEAIDFSDPAIVEKILDHYEQAPGASLDKHPLLTNLCYFQIVGGKIRRHQLLWKKESLGFTFDVGRDSCPKELLEIFEFKKEEADIGRIASSINSR